MLDFVDSYCQRLVSLMRLRSLTCPDPLGGTVSTEGRQRAASAEVVGKDTCSRGRSTVWLCLSCALWLAWLSGVLARPHPSGLSGMVEHVVVGNRLKD